ncbi:MAG: TonB-dependent receptor [Pseudomonadota bacterium]
MTSAIALAAATFLGGGFQAEARLVERAVQDTPSRGLSIVRVAEQSPRQAVQIPAGPLDIALKMVGQQTGQQVSFNPASVAGRTTTGFSGTATIKQVLRQLVSETRLKVETVGTNSFAITAPPIAVAQATELQGIVITGEIIDRSVQDAQTSVTVISGEELEGTSDADFRAIAEKAANVDLAARGIGFVIRGVNQRGVGGNADGSGALVSTSIDGLTMTGLGRSNQTFLSTWDLEQVEILRGPQSTQTGSNALAGAIVIRSKDPTYEKELKVRGAYGRGDTYQSAFALNQPIVDGKLAVRLSGDFNGTDGFVTNPTLGRDDEAEKKQTTVRAGIRFDPTADFSAVLKLVYIKHVDGFDISRADAFPNRIDLSNEDTFDKGTYRTAHLRTNYKVTDTVKVVTQTSYADKEFEFASDFDGTAADGGVIGDTNPSETFEHETKLLFNSGPVKAAFGGYYNKVKNLGNRVGILQSSALSPLLPAFTITGVSPSQTDVENYALFGEAEVRAFKKFRFIAGGRYDYEDQRFSTSVTTVASNPAFQGLLQSVQPDSSSTTETTYQAFLPKLGVVYEFTKDVSLGFTYQLGYRAGGANFNFITNTQNDFDPEFAKNYELAFRSQWWNRRLTVNANAFYVDWTDQQVQVLGPSGNPLDVTTENAGKSQVLGGELEVRVQATDQLELYANLGYTKTEFLEYISAGVSLAGNEFRNAPKFSGAVGGKYTFDNGMFAGADLSYTSAAFGDAANTFRSDTRFLLDLKAGYKNGQYEIFGYVKNVFDVDYVAEQSSADFVTAGNPRTFGVVGQVKF